MPWEKQFDSERSLDKAMQEFWVHGYEATSMRDLLSAMEINRGSFYDTFGDKRTLFIKVLKRYDKNVRQARLKALKSAYSPLEGIRALFDDWIEQVLNDPDRGGCFLTNTALELSAHDPEISEIVATSQRGLERFFLKSIREAQALGQLDPALDAHLTAKSLLASIIGMLVLSRSRPEPRLLKSIAQDALDRISRATVVTT